MWEEPGRLQSTWLRRLGHGSATSLSLFSFMHWRRKWQPTPVFLPEESQGWRSLVGCRLWGRRVGDEWSDLAAAAAAAMQKTLVQSLGWEDPLEKGKATTPVLWSGEFHGLYSTWGRKESNSTERLSLSLFCVLSNYAMLPLTITQFVKCNIDKLWNVFYALKKCRVLSQLL